MPTMRPVNQYPAEFQLVQDHMEMHPTRDGYFALWNGPVFLDVGLPFGGSQRFSLAAFPNGMWVALQDQRGQPIPLAIYIDQGAVRGKWS